MPPDMVTPAKIAVHVESMRKHVCKSWLASSVGERKLVKRRIYVEDMRKYA